VAEFPALPFWTDAYLADCQHLSWAEHGIYLMLLVHMWRSPDGKIPNNDLWLAKRLRCTEQDVANAVRPIITEFCKCDGNWIWQRRLLDELAWVRKKQRKNAASAKSRWNKEKTDANAQLTHVQSQSERISEWNAPTPTPTPTPTERKKDAAKAPEDLLWEAGVSYLRDRGGKTESNARSLIGKWVKASTPETVIELIARAQAEKVIEPVAFIEACLKRGGPKSGTEPGGYRPMGSGAGG
jgi:uncharacterized protein YdaU (DUF1376 family)